VRHGFLLPVRVIMAVFRGKMLGALRRALDRDALVLPEARRPQQWLNLLKRLGHTQKTPWNVHIRERYRHGVGVVTYLARYLRGGPIKNARLVAWDRDRVTFTCRASAEAKASGADPRSRMTLSSADFLQRWLLHVPAPQTRVVRSYGLYRATRDGLRARRDRPPVAPDRWGTVPQGRRGAAARARPQAVDAGGVLHGPGRDPCGGWRLGLAARARTTGKIQAGTGG